MAMRIVIVFMGWARLVPVRRSRRFGFLAGPGAN
jgi:hypothetical protein